MSSGPMGTDFREYTYNFCRYIVPDALQHRLSARNDWLVTRIRMWAQSNPATFRIRSATSAQIDIAANGCLCLEPNGAHREDIYVTGQDSLLLIEFWYQANPAGSGFSIFIT